MRIHSAASRRGRQGGWVMTVRRFLLIAVIAFCAPVIFLATGCNNDDDDEGDGGETLLFGVNFPWNTYRSDFGRAPWGYLGLASQGPAGWRCESRAVDLGCEGFTQVETGGETWLRVDVDVRAQDPERAGAIAFFWTDEPAGMGPNEFLDLSGQTVSADGLFPSGSNGPIDAPNGALLFIQDRDWRWAQSDWWNVFPNENAPFLDRPRRPDRLRRYASSRSRDQVHDQLRGTVDLHVSRLVPTGQRPGERHPGSRFHF